jgi:hypothetical protein
MDGPQGRGYNDAKSAVAPRAHSKKSRRVWNPAASISVVRKSAQTQSNRTT